ncbi:hypothetical protein [Maricaulis sp. CAU 1757]
MTPRQLWTATFWLGLALILLAVFAAIGYLAGGEDLPVMVLGLAALGAFTAFRGWSKRRTLKS